MRRSEGLFDMDTLFELGFLIEHDGGFSYLMHPTVTKVGLLATQDFDTLTGVDSADKVFIVSPISTGLGGMTLSYGLLTELLKNGSGNVKT